LLHNLIDPSKAILLINDALEIFPDNYYFQTNKARVYKYSKKFYEAETLFNQIRDKFDDNNMDERIKKLTVNELFDIKVRLIEFNMQNNIASNLTFYDPYNFLLTIDHKLYSFQLYKTMFKFYREILMNFNKYDLIDLLEDFMKSHYKYICFIRNDCKGFSNLESRMKSILNTDKFAHYKLDEVFDFYEYGFISMIDLDKKFGFIKVKDWSSFVYFNQLNFIGLFNEKIKNKSVRFIPKLSDGKIFAINVEINDFVLDSN